MKLRNMGLYFIFTAICFANLNKAMAQIDDLDRNSFDEPALQNEQSLPEDQEVPDANLEEDINLDADESGFDEDQGSENDKLNSDKKETFDNGALIQDQNPKSLSNQIRDLNPNDLTGEQDYFPSFIYEDRGRSDPFEPKLKRIENVEQQAELSEQEVIRAGLAKYELSALNLTAILISTKTRPKALIKDPAGTVYVIHENDAVGRNNGVVKKIRQGQVVVLEYRDQPEGGRLYTTQILSLGK